MMKKRTIRCPSVSLLGGGFGPRNFHLGFLCVLIKIYLGKPCTVRKILLSSFIVLSSFLLWVSFSRRYFIRKNDLIQSEGALEAGGPII
jgi:hypothetical protein